jgi:hypothetical protein
MISFSVKYQQRHQTANSITKNNMNKTVLSLLLLAAILTLASCAIRGSTLKVSMGLIPSTVTVNEDAFGGVFRVNDVIEQDVFTHLSALCADESDNYSRIIASGIICRDASGVKYFKWNRLTNPNPRPGLNQERDCTWTREFYSNNPSWLAEWLGDCGVRATQWNALPFLMA